MTSLNTIIRNVLGEAFVSAEAVENTSSGSATELWVDVVYATQDDSLEAKTMMGVISAVQNWDELQGRMPTVNFVSHRELESAGAQQQTG